MVNNMSMVEQTIKRLEDQLRAAKNRIYQLEHEGGTNVFRDGRRNKRRYKREPGQRGRSVGSCERCHKTVEVHGLGLCYSCYMREYMRRRRRLKKPAQSEPMGTITHPLTDDEIHRMAQSIKQQ